MTNDAPKTMERPSFMPNRTVLRIRDERGQSLRGDATVDGRCIAEIAWSLDGRLQHLKTLDDAGRPHGIELEYDDAGRIAWSAQWNHGEMNGLAIRFSEDGIPVLATSFVKGKGVDIWTNCGRVTELREVQNGIPHGLVRWGEPTLPYEEGHYVHGKRHGIFRAWAEGVLSVDYPRFYVDDVRVTRFAYDSERDTDEALPAYDVADDGNQRSLPNVVIEARRQAELIAADFSIKRYLDEILVDVIR